MWRERPDPAMDRRRSAPLVGVASVPRVVPDGDRRPSGSGRYGGRGSSMRTIPADVPARTGPDSRGWCATVPRGGSPPARVPATSSRFHPRPTARTVQLCAASNYHETRTSHVLPVGRPPNRGARLGDRLFSGRTGSGPSTSRSRQPRHPGTTSCCSNRDHTGTLTSVAVNLRNFDRSMQMNRADARAPKVSSRPMQMHVHLTESSESSPCGRYGVPRGRGRLPPSSLEGHG